MLKIGSNAPEIDLLDQHGKRFQLSELRGRKNAVVFFYPADDTTICTVEACAFRDSYETFVSNDTEVIGISAQDAASHQRFASKFSLPFRLLVDDKGIARKAYHVGRLFGLLDHRLTYVIDKQGSIISITKSTLDGEKHVADALATIP
ncbi:MAG: peroxiredoxin [Flavobacteriales bacterium]|jgi:peroxiredoxin Q/BCP|nr:peroxiredoxin [Flavobacteriales bacterium]